MQGRLDMQPIAEEIAVAILEGRQDDRLKWDGEDHVRLLTGEVLPAGSAVKETLAGRRKTAPGGSGKADRPGRVEDGQDERVQKAGRIGARMSDLRQAVAVGQYPASCFDDPGEPRQKQHRRFLRRLGQQGIIRLVDSSGNALDVNAVFKGAIHYKDWHVDAHDAQVILDQIEVETARRKKERRQAAEAGRRKPRSGKQKRSNKPGSGRPGVSCWR